MKRVFAFLIAGIAIKDLASQIPVSGLSLFLKTEAGVNVSGNNVVSWKDQSGNNHDAFSKNIHPPQLIPAALNGYPVIRFNGLDNGMTTVSFLTFPSKRGTIIIVARVNDRSLTSGVGVGNLVSTFHGNGVIWQFCATPSKYSYYDGAGAEGVPVSISPPGEWGIVTIMRSNDTTMKLFRGGRLETTFRVNNNQPDTNTLKIGFNGRQGGGMEDSISEVLNGDIAEIIIYGRALSGTELSTVDHYLSKKYNLALTPSPFWERWWFYGLAFLFFLSIVIAITQYIARRKLRRQLAELERQRELDKERQRISREMHDDIGAGLTQIVLISESAKRQANGDKQKELEEIAGTSRKLVASMNEIIWSLHPENKSLDQLMAYLREELNKLLEYSGIEYSIQLPEDGKEILLSNQQLRNIPMITKEIVHNAIKHSHAKNIRIRASLNNRRLTFEMDDDGTGFDSQKNYTGNGLKNIRQRIEELGGQLKIDSQPGRGNLFFYIISLESTT